ncbi:MAG: hypothetical protein LBS90_03365 [Oscillospiraceae bacterium]|jgi:hypothetical protein|nr:hypothetical protein [Oscillospiraceae bacterium]
MLKRVFCVVLALSFSLALIVLPAYAADEYAEQNDTPYEFPVLPGSEEWSSMTTQEAREACQIPGDTLKNMTTRALVDTVLDYPFMLELFAFDTAAAAYTTVKSRFNGLYELSIRQDAIEVLDAVIASIMSEDSVQAGRLGFAKTIRYQISLNNEPLAGTVVSAAKTFGSSKIGSAVRIALLYYTAYISTP